MTNEEIKDILDAFDRGEKMQIGRILVSGFKWCDIVYSDKKDLFYDLYKDNDVRVKPEPKVIELFTSFMGRNTMLTDTSDHETNGDTHKITYLLNEENKPILDSFKIEKI